MRGTPHTLEPNVFSRWIFQSHAFPDIDDSVLIQIEKYHGGRLKDNAPQEFLDHNERVKQIIPPEKLLVYELGQGWDPLVEFLGVCVQYLIHLT